MVITQEREAGIEQEFEQDPADVEFIKSLAARLLEFVRQKESVLEEPISQAEAGSGKSREELCENDIQRDGTKGNFSQEVHFLDLLKRLEDELEYASGDNVDLYTIDFTDFFKAIRFTDLAHDQIALANLERIQKKYQLGKK